MADQPTVEMVNGNAVFTVGKCQIVHERFYGYMLYGGGRTGIYKTLEVAIKAAERLNKLIAEGN